MLQSFTQSIYQPLTNRMAIIDTLAHSIFLVYFKLNQQQQQQQKSNKKAQLWNNYDSIPAEWYVYTSHSVMHVDCTLFAKNANFNS